MQIILIIVVLLILINIIKIKIYIISKEIDKKLIIHLGIINIKVNINNIINDINNHKNLNKIKIKLFDDYKNIIATTIKLIKINEFKVIKTIDNDNVRIRVIYYAVFEFIKNILKINKRKKQVCLNLNKGNYSDLEMQLSFEFRVYKLLYLLLINSSEIIKIRKEMI